MCDTNRIKLWATARAQWSLSGLRLLFEGSKVDFDFGVNICEGYNRGWLVFEGGF